MTASSPQQQPQHPSYPGEEAPAPTNMLAVVSLVLSILGGVGVLLVVGSIAGIITGHIARRQARERGEQGEGLAKAGAIVGWVGMVFMVVTLTGLLWWNAMASAAP
ncbi:DUF4190 domain-containing protein [Demequina sp. SO4-13]|uniref:DUF4190 domain-containing protein n=1 Tax=Demequina sp. SO4-13 TaxID=3401027 RepID=UPI003AF6A565